MMGFDFFLPSASLQYPLFQNYNRRNNKAAAVETIVCIIFIITIMKICVLPWWDHRHSFFVSSVKTN